MLGDSIRVIGEEEERSNEMMVMMHDD